MNKINLFLQKLKEMPDFDRVKFVFLFGSYPAGKQNKFSDIDFAVYHNGNKEERFKFRLKLLAKLPNEFDVQTFQDLPIYVRINVLKGKIIYQADIDFAYETAYSTIQEFGDFKRYYEEYIARRPKIK